MYLEKEKLFECCEKSDLDSYLLIMNSFIEDINIRDKSQYTPLMLCARSEGDFAPEIIKFIIRRFGKYIDFNLKHEYDYGDFTQTFTYKTALDFATESKFKSREKTSALGISLEDDGSFAFNSDETAAIGGLTPDYNIATNEGKDEQVKISKINNIPPTQGGHKSLLDTKSASPQDDYDDITQTFSNDTYLAFTARSPRKFDENTNNKVINSMMIMIYVTMIVSLILELYLLSGVLFGVYLLSLVSLGVCNKVKSKPMCKHSDAFNNAGFEYDSGLKCIDDLSIGSKERSHLQI